MTEPPASCELHLRVRYAECDPMGYVHHANYLQYFEIGRTELLRQAGVRYRDLEQQGIFFVVARAECRYRRPARYDDLLTLKVQMTRMTHARIDHRYELFRDGTLLCEASTVLACVDRSGRVIPIPEDVLRGHRPDPNRG